MFELFVICLFVYKVEKEDQFIREKQGNCEHLFVRYHL